MRRRLRIRRFSGDERGAALVEFTLVLPFLMLLAAGIAEFGFMLHQQQLIYKAVRDAGRYAARYPYATTAACALSGEPEWATMVANTKNVALRGQVSGGAFLLSSWNNVSMVTVAEIARSVPGGGSSPLGLLCTTASVISVTASAPFAGTGFLGFLGIGAFNLTASHDEMWAGL